MSETHLHVLAICTARVNVNGDTIASGSIAHLPHFDAPLRWLCGHVLLEKYVPLESNHGLIDAKVTARLEVSFELRQDEIKKGAHLEQRVVERRVMSRCICCVSQVKILVQF